MASTGAKLVTSYTTGATMLATNPTNVYADDTNYATLTSTSRNENDVLGYWHTFALGIPVGSTITQIDVVGVCRIGTSSITSALWGIQLYKGGTTAVGTEATVNTTTADIDYTATQTITTSLPSVAELNADGDSGLRIRARVATGNTNTSRTWSLVYLQVTVTYTPPVTAPPPWFGSRGSMW